MKVFSFLSACLDIRGFCLIAALVAACSFDVSQLRALASSAPDGAAEPVAGASGGGGSTASPPDAATAIGGSGGAAAGPFDAPAATGGGGGTAAGPFDAPAATGGNAGTTNPPDAPTIAGGNGGYAGGSATGGAGAVGGTTRADAGVAGSAAGGSGGGTAGRTASGGATGGTGGIGGASSYGGTTSPSSTTSPTNVLEVYLTQPTTTMGSTSGTISLDFRIDNQTSASVDLSNVTLLNWYQDDGWDTTTLTLEVDYKSISGDNVTGGKAVAAPRPTAGADHYLELSFTGTLAAKNQFASNILLHNLKWQGTVDVTNDYSYNGGATGYNSKITLYQGGKLVWGVEP